MWCWLHSLEACELHCAHALIECYPCVDCAKASNHAETWKLETSLFPIEFASNAIPIQNPQAIYPYTAPYPMATRPFWVVLCLVQNQLWHELLPEHQLPQAGYNWCHWLSSEELPQLLIIASGVSAIPKHRCCENPDVGVGERWSGWSRQAA